MVVDFSRGERNLMLFLKKYFLVIFFSFSFPFLAAAETMDASSLEHALKPTIKNFRADLHSWLYRNRHSVVVFNNTKKEFLYKRYPDHLRYPASLTKIMTLYLLFEAIEAGKFKLDDNLTITKDAAKMPPSKLNLKEGETITVEQAIVALVTKSANDVAVTVAENIARTEDDFAKLMTAKARELNMRYTKFYNASGLPNRKQVTTPREIIRLSIALQNDFPQYMHFFQRKYLKFRGRWYRTHNRLLFKEKIVAGIKTGFISDSGFNVVTLANIEGQEILIAVFGGKKGYLRDQLVRWLINYTRVYYGGVDLMTPPIPERNPKHRYDNADNAEELINDEQKTAQPEPLLPVRHPQR